MRAVPETIRVH